MQVADDYKLLELMIADYTAATALSPQFLATARWRVYTDKFIIFLKEHGLHDFRRQVHPKGTPGAVLSSFGALDGLPDNADINSIYRTAANAFVGKYGKTIENLEASRAGNPKGFEVNGLFCTISWLNYFHRYAFVTKYFDFRSKIICELGPGSGKQAELIKKAHPDCTIVLFDLPTQLYVCNQYLTKVFEGQNLVVDYRDARDIVKFSDLQMGKIHLLGNWRFPIISKWEIDLFWNAASLQEMERETADGYLQLAKHVKNMFLMHLLNFKPGDPLPGERGVIGGVSMQHFIEVDRIHARHANNRNWMYYDSFWRNTLS